MAFFKRKGEKEKYSFSDRLCIGRECWHAGMFQHRSPMSAGGSRNTGSPDTPCCMNRAYRGCPAGPMGQRQEMDEQLGLVTIQGLPVYDENLAKKRKLEGWKLV